MTELLKFNNQLHISQNKIIKEVRKLDRELTKKVEDKNDDMIDYEIDLELDFYLKEDDKEWKKGDDNIIMTLNEHLTGLTDERRDTYPWDDTNHNEFHIRYDPHNMKDEHHCWLYHCLYDHTELTWEDILRIGSFWIDIKVRYQYRTDVNTESTLTNIDTKSGD